MNIVVVGDTYGVPQVLGAVRGEGAAVAGIVGASNRPQYHVQLQEYAHRLDVPFVVQPAWGSSDYDDFVRAVAAVQPDLFICNSYSMILREEVLRLARAGGVNVHGGKLPEFRGPNPLQWAIISGERETAVTMHHMTAVVDGGDVIAQRPVPIDFEDRWRVVSQRLTAATEDLLATELPAVLAGTAARVPQDERRARNRGRRSPEDGRIDWDTGVLAVYNLIRALGDGIPPAFYEVDGERVELDRYVSIAEATALSFSPGPGGRRVERDGVRLVPETRDDDVVGFRVFGGRASRGGLHDLDPQERTVRMRLDADDDVASGLLADFAGVELGLRVV